MIGVGAVFDFVAGMKSHAPKFVQAIGLEWLFRPWSEPSRLWRRYLVGNTKFMSYVMRWLVVRNLERCSCHKSGLRPGVIRTRRPEWRCVPD